MPSIDLPSGDQVARDARNLAIRLRAHATGLAPAPAIQVDLAAHKGALLREQAGSTLVRMWIGGDGWCLRLEQRARDKPGALDALDALVAQVFGDVPEPQEGAA